MLVMKGGGGTLVLLMCSIVAALTSANESQHEIHEEQLLGEDQYDGEFSEDALGNWLTNFDTYTFMVKEDVDAIDQDDSGSNSDVVVDDEAVEEDAISEDEEQSPYAPITVSLGDRGLLNPHIQYQVLVESLVAEEGSVFITLGKYANKSLCGVGGFSLDFTQIFNDDRSKSHLDIEHKVEDFNTTIIAFAIKSESNISFHKGSSSWDEIGQDFWWARGRLVGGGLLVLNFAPPKCGCLTLSTYYALPVGNMTLVVGPQAYPTELQMLMCVDPAAKYQEQVENEDLLFDDDTLMYPTDLNVPVNRTMDIPQMAEEDDRSEDENDHHFNKVSKQKTRRNGRKEAKRLARKRKRQQRKQKIRQTGRRRVRQQLRQESKKKLWNRKRGQKGKKLWRTLRKNALANASQHGGQQREHHQDNSTQLGKTTDEHLEENLEGFNSTGHQVKQKRLIDILLGMTSSNSTHNEDSINISQGSSEGEDNEVPEEETEGTARSRRKNRRQRKKWKRRGKKNVHGPGAKFCCKQGVKHKKYLLILNNTLGEDISEHSCNSVSDIVTTFANHQFAVAQNICESTFSTCCSIFTNDMWNDLKAKKTARKMQRRNRQKSRRQHRKQLRQERRQRREQKKKQQ